MIIVSDTTPLHYLILIEQADLLPTLFGEIVVPGAVLAELTHERAPDEVRRWCRQPPAWLQIRTPPESLVGQIEGLGKGETEAIALAMDEHADALLMDDKKAIREARRRQLVVITLLGVLELAAIKGLTDLQTGLDALRQTSFRMPNDEIIHAFLTRDTERKSFVK